MTATDDEDNISLTLLSEQTSRRRAHLAPGAANTGGGGSSSNGNGNGNRENRSPDRKTTSNVRDKSVKFESNVESFARKNIEHSQKKSKDFDTIVETETEKENPNDDEHSTRPFDLVIFAASSSVGRYLVEELSLVVDKYYSTTTTSSNESAAAAATADSSPTASINHQFSYQSTATTTATKAKTSQTRRSSVPSSSKSGNTIKWAIAGRSAVRLSETLCQAELSTGIRNLSSAIPVILADLNHQRSLLNLCSKTRLVLNCAGPYSELGAELLIEACIQQGTHYVDLAHETTFIETIAQLYSERAKRKNVLILNGCGFQSMSAECGINFVKQVADGRIEQVKIILSLSDTSALIRLGPARAKPQAAGIVSRGMWNSLLVEKAQEISIEERMRHTAFNDRAQKSLIFSSGGSSSSSSSTGESDQLHQENLLENTKQNNRFNWRQNESQSKTATATATTATNEHDPRPLRLLERKDTLTLVKDIVQFRNRAVSIAWPLQLIQGFQIQKGRGYCWPIDTLTSDEAQLIRSEMNNYELRRPDLESSDGWRPIRTSGYLSVKSFTHLCILFLWLFVFQILVKFSLSRYLMRKLPQLASLGHVSSVSSGQIRSSSSPKQTLDRDALSHIKYCQTFIAYGQPSDESGDPLEERDKNKTRRQVQLLVSRVVGPEPNHVATATFAVQAALTVLMERDHLPVQGGVLTPGAAFSETNIIYQLRRRNIKFEVLKKA